MGTRRKYIVNFFCYLYFNEYFDEEKSVIKSNITYDLNELYKDIGGNLETISKLLEANKSV